jgi:hypothetical protein
MQKQDLAQMMKQMLERMDDIKEMKASQAKMEARMEANVDSMKAELISTIKNFKFNGEETTACQETMEARLEVEEPASVDRTPEVANEEVPREGAARMPVGGLRRRRRDRHLAAVRCQNKTDQHLDARRRRKGQERAQRKDGCRRSLVAARRGMTRHAVVVRRRILPTKDTNRELHGSRKRLVAARKGTTRRAVVVQQRTLFTKTTRSRLIVTVREVPRPTVARCRRDATKEECDNARRAPGERTPGKRRRVNPEGKTTMKDPDARWKLHLRNVKTAG